MSSIKNQLCPLCGKASEIETFDSSRRKLVKCKTCNEFFISIDAEKHPRMSYSDAHKDFRTLARHTPQDQILVISVKGGKIHPERVLRSSVIG